MQATVATFEPSQRCGTVLLDDGRPVSFGANAFDASGLRLLRLGQRVQLEVDDSQNVTRLWIPTMR